MPEPARPEQPITPDTTSDEGEDLLRRATHEVDPGDMTDTTAP